MGKSNDRTIYKSSDGWINKRIDAKTPDSIHNSQSEALIAARNSLQQDGGGQIIIHSNYDKLVS